MMTTKQDFTVEEWDLLLAAPVHATTYVMTADISIMGAIREMRALDKFFTQSTPPEDAAELIHQVLADIEGKGKNKEKLTMPTAEAGQDAREPARQGLRGTAALVESECTPEEASAFKQWLADIAQAIAVADKEGSHFGIGGKPISEKEQAALTEINELLNR
jgi:hypothetical protein